MSFGNKCDHDKEAPRLFERSKELKRPPLAIEIAMRNADEFYFQRGAFLQNIAYARMSMRQQRSESREAVASLVKVLVSHCDMEDMQVVRYRQGNKSLVTVLELARIAGLGYKRCQRAMKVLKEAGYLKLKIRYERVASGEIKPLIAIKKILPRMFLDLGVTGELLRSCQNYIFKQMKKVKKKGKKVDFKAKQVFSQPTSVSYAPIKQPTFQQEKLKVEKLYKLKLQNPSWTTSQLRAAI